MPKSVLQFCCTLGTLSSTVQNKYFFLSFKVFELFSSYSDKLAPLGSTQSNESFNNSVSVHAPKRLHFSGSASLEGRVAFAVATKNSGKSVVCKV